MRRRSFRKLSNDSPLLCLRNFSLCLALVFSRSYVGFKLVKNFYWVGFFSLVPLERLLDFSGLWTYPCSEPTGFLFCFAFAERPVEREANMTAKAAKLLVQISAVRGWSNGIWDIVLGWNSVSDGFFNAKIYWILRSILTPCNILKPCCLLHTFDGSGFNPWAYDTSVYSWPVSAEYVTIHIKGILCSETKVCFHIKSIC